MIAPLAQEIQTGGSLQYIEALVFTVLFLTLLGWVAGKMATDTDRHWLQRYVVWGYLAKVFGSLARYWMVTGLYERGDSYSYHTAAEGFANIWRALAVPVSSAGGEGTAFTEITTGLIYAIYTPTFLGGFLLFATAAFIGQLLFYASFRRWFGAEKQRLYALAVFFFPSMIFWPSSIGKDALMVLFLGIAAFGASRLLNTYKIFGSALLIVMGLGLAAGIRPHVAGTLALALVFAVLLGKPLERFRGSPKRPLMLVTAAACAAFVLATFSATFEVGIEAQRGQTDLGSFLEDVSERTAGGGSQIEGVAITTPSRLPLATITVLFRPLLHEGTSPQVLVSALEGTAMLGLVIWKFPQIWKNRRLLRRKAYTTLCFFYTGGFIIGFSAFQNLGILARQRVQLLPFFLALVVGLGWPEPREGKPRGDDGLEAHSTPPSPPPRPTRLPAYSAARRWPRPDIPPSSNGDEPDQSNTDTPSTEEVPVFEAQKDAQELAEPQTERMQEPAQPEPERLKEPAQIQTERVKEAVQPEAELKQVPTQPEAERRQMTGKHLRPPTVRDRIRPEVVALRTSDPELSIREIARRVDASPSTVRRVLVEEELV